MTRRQMLLAVLVFPAAAIAAAERDERQRCACIEGRLDHVQSELRAGYSARRGRRLKDRQRDLEEQQRKTCR